MKAEGKYIYCVIETKHDRNFGPIGIGGRGDEVLTVGHGDLNVVVSNHPMGKITANRQNMVGHERVIEEVMKEFDSVLPVRFGTIASSVDEIRNLLDRRSREFKCALRDMDHKVELGVKGIWKDMNVVLKQISSNSQSIRNLKGQAKGKSSRSVQTKIEIGQLVKDLLDRKKEDQAQEIVDRLRRTSFDYKLNRTIGDEMFMNASFLVSKGGEKEFDNTMDELSDEYEDRMKFLYAGPLPVFNFVSIVIYPDEWEK